MLQETSLETTTIVGTPVPPIFKPTILELIPRFLQYAQFELSLAPQTIAKYKENLLYTHRDIGTIPVTDIKLENVIAVKQKMFMRGCGESRVSQIVFALKGILKFCAEVLELPVMDQTRIKPPKHHRREVIFLTKEEIEQFVNSIKIDRKWQGKIRKKAVRINGLRFRTLVEVLLGTGMRISEALSLDRGQIDYEKAEAKIIGKGNKQRTVFFNQRSLDWVKYYLEQRSDTLEPIFITSRGTRFSREDVSGLFKRYVKKSGITKHLTPHTLRHTMATHLLFNGCPINHVKEILGHDRLETTCKYYLGVDKSKAKEAHKQFLNY
ncbi:MAG: tyrosine-type recombinase/integrase [Candidatus Doudnabacteria bacterium]|nr:tyrosine-type recombinase/integrase [Candidatus Doudnabacteria bacterium]